MSTASTPSTAPSFTPSTAGVPAGYHAITPAIIVRGAVRALDVYARAFGAVVVTRMDMPDGSLAHAEIRIGDSVLMLGDENPAWGLSSPQTLGGTASSLHLYVPDADAAVARALAAGCTLHSPLEDAFWGDRYGKVTDPFGHVWGLATRQRDLTEQETMDAMHEWMAKMGSGDAAQA